MSYKYRMSLEDLPGCAGDNTDRELLESFYFRCKIKNLAAASLKNCSDRLWFLMRYAKSIKKPLAVLTCLDMQNYLMSIIEKVSPATVNGRIAVFKVFYNHLYTEGLLESNPSAKLKKVREPHKIKPVLSSEEITQILKKQPRKNFFGNRNFCMILLTFDGMLRINELLSIKTGDLDLTSRLVKIDGKGSKQRYVPFSHKTAQVLHLYLIRYRKKIPGDVMFPGFDGEKMIYRTANKVFKQAGQRIGLKTNPHLYRHSGASQFIRSGGNVAILQKVLGHSSLVVTQRYVHLSTEDMVNAYENFSPTAGLRL